MNPTPETPRRRLTGAVLPALAAAALAGLATLYVVGREPGGAISGGEVPSGCILDGAELVGGPISLVDVNGRTVTPAELSEGPSVLYFGFTHCPDICPTTMYSLTEALNAMGEPGFDLQPVLITLDPERDTTDVMDAYIETEGFPPGLIGLTGTPAQVNAAAEAFKVVSRRAPIEGNAIDYNVDHSSMLYLMDQNWRTRAVMTTVGKTPQEIAACLSAGLARID